MIIIKTTYNIFDKPDVSEQNKFLSQILEKEPPYKKNKFDVNWYSDLINISEIAINSFCENCGTERIFKGTVKDEMCKVFVDDVFKAGGRNPNSTQSTKISDFYKDKQYFLNLQIHCALCGETHYYSLVFINDIVIKIGQYPSFASKSEHELLKYKNIISKYYIELNRSVNAYSQHMGIAAFVYLRRIFEHIVETEYPKIQTPTGKECFDKKFKAVDNELHLIPPELNAQKSKIYSVLSKGIHEYDEDECYEIYPYMKAIILIIMDKYLIEKERAKQLEQLSKLLEQK